MTITALPTRPRVLADLVPGALVRDIALVAAGAALTGAAAQAQFTVPALSPVPFTAQTFAVLTIGAALGPGRALASMALYLTAGLAGVPWFAAGKSGYAFASFGYLIGFAAAATVVGLLARRGGDRTPLRAAGTMAAGNLIVYVCGLPVLIAATHMPVATALRQGAGVFLLPDAIKIAIAAGLLPSLWAGLRLLGLTRPAAPGSPRR
jgi:biotin transport system substrate-specific component